MRFPSKAAVAALSLASVVVAASALGGCSSKQGTQSPSTGTNTPGTPTDNGGIDGTGQGLAGHDTNPEGVAYPTKNIGYQARGVDGSGNANKTPGNVMANYKFLGYPNADESKGLQTVALADYFDPTGAKYKVVHIIVAGVWCGPCNQETDALVKALNDPTQAFDKKGVAYVQALGDGPSEGTGATNTDLLNWITTHHSNFTEVLDPNVKNLGVFFDAAAIPWNADLDARTMEILQDGVGYEDPAAVQTWLDWVSKNPATKF
jgi:hypothetical protein